MHTHALRPHGLSQSSELIQSRRTSTERARGRKVAQEDIRQAIAALLRQSDAQLGGTEQLRLAYRAELERQWSKV